DGARQEVDAAFPVLHGPFGEDGAIQGLLEMAGVPYVGAGALGPALGMAKAIQTVLFQAAGLPVVPHAVVHERGWREAPERVAAVAGVRVLGAGWYGFRGQDLYEGSELEIPAGLPAEVAIRLQRLAVAAFHAAACGGMVRVDFF